MDKDLSILDKVFRLELSTFIIDDPVKRVDNMTMSHALESRVPFLDIELIKFMLSVKGKSKINKSSKYYLKRLAERYLKKEVIYRDKFYFPVPPLKFIKDKFYKYCKDILSSEAALQRGIYKKEYISKLLAKPNNNFTNLNGNELWHFTLLERWLQLNIDV
jgi:asparagine synthase (glutamine-hydrolysing)